MGAVSAEALRQLAQDGGGSRYFRTGRGSLHKAVTVRGILAHAGKTHQQGVSASEERGRAGAPG
ncbi:hypothetical protein [Brevibacillus gelatini]